MSLAGNNRHASPIGASHSVSKVIRLRDRAASAGIIKQAIRIWQMGQREAHLRLMTELSWLPAKPLYFNRVAVIGLAIKGDRTGGTGCEAQHLSLSPITTS